MVDVAQLRVVVDADTGAAERGLDSFGGKVGGIGSSIATAFGGAAIAGIAGVAAGLGTAVASAAGFESTMSAVKAVSGATADEMSQLSGLALQLGKDTSFSASEAGKGIEELVKGGLSIPDIMNGAAQATLNLAAAGGVSLPDAATIAANALAQFNLKGEDMAHVADLIAGAANASALDVGDFKFSLQAAGAVASTVGFSFDDLAQAIAVMGKAGITGSDAGTSLKTMMMRLQPTTNETRDLFRDLGLITTNVEQAYQSLVARGIQPASHEFTDIAAAMQEHLGLSQDVASWTQKDREQWEKYSTQIGLTSSAFFDANGKVKSMAEVAQVLQEKLGGMTEAQKMATLQTMFGSDAIRAAAVLTKEGAAGFNEMAEAMGKVTAEAVGAEKLNNLAGSWEQMKGSAETLAITIGMELLPALKDIVDGATGVINAMIPLAERTIPRVVAAFKNELGPVIDWFKTNWPLIQQTYHTVVGGIEGDNARLSATMSTTWGGMRGIVGERIGEIGDILRLTMHTINGDWEGAWKDLAAISDREEKIRNENTKRNAEIGQGLIDTFTGGALTRVQTDMRRLNDDIWAPAWETIKDTVRTAWDGASGIAAQIDASWSTITTGTDTAGRALNNVIVGIWDAIYTSVIRPKLDAITGAVDAAWQAIAAKTHEILDPWLAYVRDTIFEPVRSAVETKINAARDLAAAAWQAVSDTAHAVLDPVLAYVRDTIFGAMQTKVEGASTGISTAFEGAVNAVRAAVDTTLGAVKSTWETTWTAIQRAAESPQQAMNVLIELVDKLKRIMPEWLIPHSPTPFQIGLEGIMKAARSMDGAFGNMAGVEGWITAAMRLTGVPERWLSGLTWLAQHESSGNPRAVNPEAVSNGEHASGLFQTIPSTFARFRDKELPDDIFNPIANAVAAIRYILRVYGDIDDVISGWARRGGYAEGGWAGLHGPELAWLGEKGPEYVVPNHALRGGHGFGGMQTVRVDVAIGGRVAEQIYVEGRELAIRRGRAPAGAT